MLNFYPVLETFGDLVVIILQRGKFCPHEKNENEMLKNEQKMTLSRLICKQWGNMTLCKGEQK